MTIKDLARLSGYSLGTVSRVLNNQPNVSDKARAAILAIAEESGFELNESAQLLKQQRSNAVLIIVKGTANEMFASMVEQLQSLFSRTTHPLIVDFIDEDENEVLRAVKLCRERKPVGVMFLGGTNRYFCGDFEKIHVPAVVVTNDASELPFENLSSVTTNDRQGAACAVDYLIRCGHRQIAVLGGDRSLSDTSAQRYEAAWRRLRKTSCTSTSRPSTIPAATATKTAMPACRRSCGRRRRSRLCLPWQMSSPSARFARSWTRASAYRMISPSSATMD